MRWNGHLSWSEGFHQKWKLCLRKSTLRRDGCLLGCSTFSESSVIVMLLIFTVGTFGASRSPQLPLQPLFPYHLELLSKGWFGAILSFSDLSDLELFWFYLVLLYTKTLINSKGLWLKVTVLGFIFLPCWKIKLISACPKVYSFLVTAHIGEGNIHMCIHTCNHVYLHMCTHTHI